MQSHRRLILLGIIIAFGLLIPALLSTSFAFRATVAGAPLSLRDDGAVTRDLTERFESYSRGDLTLTTPSGQLQLAAASLAPRLDTGASLREARAALRRESLGERLRRVFFGRDFPARVQLDRDRLAGSVAGWAGELSVPVENAELTIRGGELEVRRGQVGQRLSLAETVIRIDEAARHLDRRPVKLSTYLMQPLVTSADLEAVRPTLARWTSDPVRFMGPSGEELAALSPSQILGLTSLQGVGAESGVRRVPTEAAAVAERFILGATPRPGLRAGLDLEATDSYMDTLAARLERPARNVVLVAQPGPVRIAAPSRPGQGVDREALLARFQKALESEEARTVPVPTREVLADVREDNLAALGIVERVSEGTSSFAVSPDARIHNIQTGTSKFSSVLVKAGETFSFNKILGDVDAGAGYLPELVILRDKTVPEFGGGLCQVSSTAWRGSLDLGLPTLSRVNHSYAVSYYFPIGTDATIYLPYPDMQWRNTTGHALLIQARVEGSGVYFTYFGTNPGWTVQFSRDRNFSSPVSRAVDLPNYFFNEESDGSKDTIFYRRVLDAGGGVVLADKYFSHYESPDKFPHTEQN